MLLQSVTAEGSLSASWLIYLNFQPSHAYCLGESSMKINPTAWAFTVFRRQNFILLEDDICVILGEEFPTSTFSLFCVDLSRISRPKQATSIFQFHFQLPATGFNPPQLRSDRSGQLIQDFVWQRIGKFL
ncbi:hypothetical protein LB506_007054 [Fusarium annulatum]|nr:hypothetical protein LB506_007054 [Fusarium annulatum]